MTIAYSYIRFSTKGQADGDSLRRQTERARKYAEKHGLKLDEELHMQDLGKSAFSGDHIETGAFGEFLKAIEIGKVKPGSVLLVESHDRMSRETPFIAQMVFSKIISAGIDIVTLMDEARYSRELLEKDPKQIFELLTEMLRAHKESKRKKDFSISNWSNKRKDLLKEKKKYTKKCPAWLKYDDKLRKFVLVPDYVEVIEEIIQHYKDGLGYHSIADMLNRRGTPTFENKTRKAERWASAGIRNIILSPALWGAFEMRELDTEGKRRVGSGKYIEEYFEPVIEKREWLYLLGLSASRNHKKGAETNFKKGNGGNLFTKVMKCAYCGGPVAVNSDNFGFKYYVCQHGRTGSTCRGIQWNQENLERAFLRYVSEVNVEGLLTTKSEASETEKLFLSIEALKSALEKSKRKRDNLISIQAEIEEHVGPETKRLIIDEAKKISRLTEDVRVAESEYLVAKQKDEESKQQKGDIDRLLNSFFSDPSPEVRKKLAHEIRKKVKTIFFYPFGNVQEGLPASVAAASKAAVERIGPVWAKTGDVELAKQLMGIPIAKPAPYAESRTKYADLMEFIPRFLRVEFASGRVEYLLVGEGSGYLRVAEELDPFGLDRTDRMALARFEVKLDVQPVPEFEHLSADDKRYLGKLAGAPTDVDADTLDEDAILAELQAALATGQPVQ